MKKLHLKYGPYSALTQDFENSYFAYIVLKALLENNQDAWLTSPDDTDYMKEMTELNNAPYIASKISRKIWFNIYNDNDDLANLEAGLDEARMLCINKYEDSESGYHEYHFIDGSVLHRDKPTSTTPSWEKK